MSTHFRTIRSLFVRKTIGIVLILPTLACLRTTEAVGTPASPIGWAAVPGYGVESTTGGGDGEVVTATTASELASYASSSQPLTIMVEGTITGSGNLDIASNKTIVGAGSGATITGLEFHMSDVSNIIIRNLYISGARDAIATRGTHHVWIDHVDVSDCDDGLIDITNESDFHTVSWSRLSNHDKTMLINSGTSKPEDAGKLNTTLHHNSWDGTNQRNPRVGYGKVHVFNNFYEDTTSYAVGLHSQSKVLVERNYFDNVNNPIKQMYRDDPADIHHGFAESVDNIFANNTRGDFDDEGISFPVNDYYLYDFSLDEAADVPSLVQAHVGPGAEYGELGLLPIPGNGAVGLSTSPTLRWTKGQEATEYVVSLGTTFPLPELGTVSGQSYSPTMLSSDTLYYWRVDQITPTGTLEGETWRFLTETIELSGDYNGNGVIDLADYTVWRNSLGGTVLLNDPTPGTVDQSDYAYWKAHFGETISSVSSTVIPEPGALLLSILGSTILLQPQRWILPAK